MIIGFTGLARSGKDTTVAIIQGLLQSKQRVEVKRFASPLKVLAYSAFGENFDEPDTKEKVVQVAVNKLASVKAHCISYIHSYNGRSDTSISVQDFDTLFEQVFKPYRKRGYGYSLSPRLLQQLIGTDVFRKLADNFWVELLLATTKDNIITLIPDVRFPNELAVCDVVIHVSRKTASYLNHPSEHMAKEIEKKGLDAYLEANQIPLPYMQLDNNGSLSDLKQLVINRLSSILPALHSNQPVALPELVVSAACRAVSNGKEHIVLGVRHFDRLMSETIEMMGISSLDFEEGFITNKGRYITRQEAMQLALANNQIRRTVSDDTRLYSENLY